MINLITLNNEWNDDVVAHNLEIPVVEQVLDVALGASKEVVQADYLVAEGQQALTEVRAQEACPTRNENSPCHLLSIAA